MDHTKYIEYILILRNFFQINDYPIEIIRIIIMSIYRDFDIGSGSCASHLFFYDRQCPKLICYAWGNNTHGELGIGHTNKVTMFQQRLFEEPVKLIVCG